jgi:DNA-binding transcriptional ArsR family regulator
MNDERNPVPVPNRLVHEPARLAILTVLCSCRSADFVFLQCLTGLSKANLSVQLTNLEQAGLVIITKEIIAKTMRTTVGLSKRGASEIDRYWQTRDAIRARMAGDERRRRSSRRRAVPLSATLSPASMG